MKHAMPQVALVTRATEHTSMTRSGILHRPWALFGPTWLGVAIQIAEILLPAALVSGQSLKVAKSLSSLDALRSHYKAGFQTGRQKFNMFCDIPKSVKLHPDQGCHDCRSKKQMAGTCMPHDSQKSAQMPMI